MKIDLEKLRLTRKGVVVSIVETSPMIGKLFIPKTARERTTLGRVVVGHSELPELPKGCLVFFDPQAPAVSIGDAEERLSFFTKEQILAVVDITSGE